MILQTSDPDGNLQAIQIIIQCLRQAKDKSLWANQSQLLLHYVLLKVYPILVGTHLKEVKKEAISFFCYLE